MKKILSLVLAALLVLSMAACAPAENGGETTTAPTVNVASALGGGVPDMHSAVLYLHRQHINVEVHIYLGYVALLAILGIAEVALEDEAGGVEP